METSQPASGIAATWWTRLPTWAKALAIVALTVIAYLPVLLHGGWVWDDPEYILKNPLISNRVSDLWQIWVPFNTPQYYPLVFTSFWVEHNLWGTAADGSHDPTGYHLINVLLHAANGVLVWRLFAVLRVPWPWLIGAVFALHPMHVESAAWITERKNTLSGFFYLLAALAYLRFDDATESTSPAHKVRWRWYVTAFACFVLALLSKTVTSSLPAALILAMLFQRKLITARRLLPLLPMFVVGVAMGLLTAWIERRIVGAEAFTAEQNMPWLARLIVVSKVLWFYPTKLLWPWPLIFNYPRWEIDPSQWTQWIPMVLAVGLGAVLVWFWRRGARGPFLALSLFAGTIFPAAGIVYVFPHKYSFVADHFCYLASLGVIALAVAGLARVVSSPRGTAWVGGALIGACGVLTWLQGGDYRSEEYLWHSTLARNPQSWMGHNNLAAGYYVAGESALKRGRAAAARPFFELAEKHAAGAVAFKPDHYKAHLNRANALLHLGRHAEAVRHFEASLEIMMAGYADNPAKLRTLVPLVVIYDHLGQCHAALGRFDLARDAFEMGLDVDERDFLTHLHLGEALLRLSLADAAAQHFAAALRALPPAGTVMQGNALRPPPKDARTQSILRVFAEASESIGAHFTGIEAAHNTARIRVALFLALPPVDEFRDLHQAGELLQAVLKDAGRPIPEVLTAADLVAEETRR